MRNSDCNKGHGLDDTEDVQSLLKILDKGYAPVFRPRLPDSDPAPLAANWFYDFIPCG